MAVTATAVHRRLHTGASQKMMAHSCCDCLAKTLFLSFSDSLMGCRDDDDDCELLRDSRTRTPLNNNKKNNLCVRVRE